MGIFWFALGILAALSCWYLWNRSLKTGLSKGAWVLGIITIIMGLFALSWVAASIGEGEVRAAAMGALIFGGISLVLFICFRRIADKGSRETAKSVSKTINA